MLLLNQNIKLASIFSVACLKILFFIYKAYAKSQKCALMHGAVVYLRDIQNMNIRFIVKYPTKLW